jgi:hypothetical protein
MSPLQKSRSTVSLFEARVFNRLPTEETLSEKSSSRQSFDGSPIKGHEHTSPMHTLGGLGSGIPGYTATAKYDQDEDDEDTTEHDFTNILSSTSTNALFVQIIPILILHPFKNLASFFIIAYVWIFYMTYIFPHQQFISLLCALITSPLISGATFPLIGIIAKWLIIGRYKPGKYPLFGTM